MSFYGKYETEYNGTLTVSQNGIFTTFDFHSGTYSDVLRLLCISNGNPVSIGIPIPDGSTMRLNRRFTKDALKTMGLETIDSAVLFPISKQYETVITHVHDSAEAASEEIEKKDDTALSQITEDEAAEADSMEKEPAENSSAEPPPEKNKMGKSPSQQPEPRLEPLINPNSDIPPGWSSEPNPSKYFTDPVLKSSSSGFEGVLSAKEGNITYLAFPYSQSEPFPLITAFRFGRIAKLGNNEYVIFRLKDGNLI